MRITAWVGGLMREAPLGELGAIYGRGAWISVVDPSLRDIGRVTEALGLPEHSLAGSLRSSYPHVEASRRHAKVFTWFLRPSKVGRGPRFVRLPVVAYAGVPGVVTLSPAAAGLQERVAARLEAPGQSPLPLASRVVHAFAEHALDNYEAHAEELERYVDELEALATPWPKAVYVEASQARKEASRLLRIIRHYRIMAESLSRRAAEAQAADEEARLMEALQDRALGVEEAADTVMETIRDLVALNLEAVSYEMNLAMRLMASITVIMAAPTVIGSLFGMNLAGNPWPWTLWQVFLVCASVALFLAAYFWGRGWFRTR